MPRLLAVVSCSCVQGLPSEQSNANGDDAGFRDADCALYGEKRRYLHNWVCQYGRIRTFTFLEGLLRLSAVVPLSWPTSMQLFKRPPATYYSV